MTKNIYFFTVAECFLWVG